MVDDARMDIPPQIVLRVPGPWRDRDELTRRLPCGYQLMTNALRTPDHARLRVTLLGPDDEFASVFASVCSRMPSDRDRRTIEHHALNVCLGGQGGTIEAARRMMRAAAALVRAGGAGVFIDNCMTAHGSDDWLALAEDPDPGGAFWAFVATIGSDTEVWSHGMHVLGCRDAIMPRTGDDEEDCHRLNCFLGYTYQSGEPVVAGDLVGDEQTAHFRLEKDSDDLPPHTPLHNPYGRWRLVAIEQ